MYEVTVTWESTQIQSRWLKTRTRTGSRKQKGNQWGRIREEKKEISWVLENLESQLKRRLLSWFKKKYKVTGANVIGIRQLLSKKLSNVWVWYVLNINRWQSWPVIPLSSKQSYFVGNFPLTPSLLIHSKGHSFRQITTWLWETWADLQCLWISSDSVSSLMHWGLFFKS